MATYSSILAWEIPRTEPGGLQSLGLQRIGHNLATKQPEQVNITKKKQTHRHRKGTSDYQWGEGSKKGPDRGGKQMGYYGITGNHVRNFWKL